LVARKEPGNADLLSIPFIGCGCPDVIKCIAVLVELLSLVSAGYTRSYSEGGDQDRYDSECKAPIMRSLISE
jgi:hypothetical protein